MTDAQTAVRSALLALPGVNEGVAYGTPIFNIGKKMIARLREDGVLVLKTDHATRNVLLDTEPEAYFLEDHYRRHPLVLVLTEVADLRRLNALIKQSWEALAPKRLIAVHRKLDTSPRGTS